MNILDIAIAKKLAGGGGGSGTDNYNDLSNLPKINDTTLSGNKSSSALGLQSEINSDSKLASDLVDDTNQDNKFVTSTEKNTWNGKQNAIDSDHKINADYVDDSTSTNKFVTASDKETWNAKQNAIDNSHKLSSDLVDDTNHTNKFVTSTEKQTWNAKQNAIDADHKLSSSLVSFTTAEAAALASGIDSSKVGQISTNQTNILYSLNTGVKNLFEIREPNYITPSSTATINGTSLTVACNNSTYRRASYKISLAAGTYIFSCNVTAKSSVPCAVRGSSVYDGSGTVIISDQTISSTGDFHFEFTLASDTTFYLVFYVNMSDTAQTANITVEDIMVCEKSVYNADPTYEPYAISNNSLTLASAFNANNGVKNIWDFANATVSRDYHITYTKTNYNIVLDNLSASNGYAFVAFPIYLNVGNYAMQFNVTNATVYHSAIIRLAQKDDGNNPVQTISFKGKGIHNALFSITTAGTYYIIMSPCWEEATGDTSTITVSECMICNASVFAADSSYQPPALPNSDLTQLEAEDRAALAEVVDSGAKNIADLSSTGTGTHNAVTFTNLGDNRYKINGTPSAGDTHLDIMGTWSTIPSFISENVGKTIVFATNQEHVYYGIIPIVGGSALEYVSGNKTTPTAYTIPSNLSGALLRIYVDTNQTYNNVTAELLVCTKAAFGVSKAFVPYRPNYDFVCDSVIDLNDMISSFVINSSKPVTIKLRRDGSFSMLMFGFVQTIGQVHWYVQTPLSGDTLSVIDAITGQAVSQSVISFNYNYSTSTLTISASTPGNCNFVLIRSAY